MAQQLDLEVRQVDGVTVVEITGDIDIDTAPQLRDVVFELTEAGSTSLVFDLSKVTFVDSIGLGVFVLARKKMQLRQGFVGVVAPTRRVIAIFKISGLDSLFRLRPTLAAVLADEDPAEPALPPWRRMMLSTSVSRAPSPARHRGRGRAGEAAGGDEPHTAHP